MSLTSQSRFWSSLAPLAVVATLLVFTASSSAAGGRTIASAPTIAPGQLVAGAGGKAEYWRIALVEGDLMTVRADGGTDASGRNLNLIDPKVDDYTLSKAVAVSRAGMAAGKSQFYLTSPFTGLGTIEACCRSCCSGNSVFVFTITIAHATNVIVAQTPRRVRRGRSFRISARVQSPAGTPTGACVFRPIKGRGGRLRGPVPLTNGMCSARVRAGQGRAVRYRVQFEADAGWRDASALTRKITVQRRGS